MKEYCGTFKARAPCGATHLYTSGLPEIFTPVDIIQRRAHHAAAGRSVNKLVVGIINTDVKPTLARPGFEKNQIPWEQVIFINFGAYFSLFTRLPGELQIKLVAEGH